MGRPRSHPHRLRARLEDPHDRCRSAAAPLARRAGSGVRVLVVTRAHAGLRPQRPDRGPDRARGEPHPVRRATAPHRGGRTGRRRRARRHRGPSAAGARDGARRERDRGAVRAPALGRVRAGSTDTGRAALVRVLDPLRDASGAHGELLRVLRVFLASNGQHRASARDLEMHRQTLAARLSRIEELTGLSLERADDRATAWMALRGLGESAL
ncbi:helix-turn-helix domain-containing protein [Leucobacter tardus]|uniref:helix-turn-helix domain-containing protein n=1 Tax=Leucobacter tardus TaxID=501483 RepID=UPI001FB8B26E|nr:helix-turn-helix domain-containing protein [Leucobacter tardus]